jgi:tRNA pseudouridine38-40 synthase
MRTLKLVIEYDGSEYVGWQRQPEGVSIQGLLEDALAPFEGQPVTVHGAGRTDAGAHALAQVATVSLSASHDTATLKRALNAVLPVDVRVLDVAEAAPDFHARFSAVSKVYEYRIVNAPFVSAFLHRYVWHVPAPLDLDAMRAGAAALRGHHDFAAFQAAGTSPSSTERTMTSIEVMAAPPAIALRVEGDGFLRHMVRAMAGTLVDVGLGRWTPDDVAEILASRDRTRAGRAAPACGLFLIEVKY